MYSYQTSNKKEDEANGLLNNAQHIRNDLGFKQNKSNLERQKLGMAGCSSDDDDGSCKGNEDYWSSSRKNQLNYCINLQVLTVYITNILQLKIEKQI